MLRTSSRASTSGRSSTPTPTPKKKLPKSKDSGTGQTGHESRKEEGGEESRCQITEAKETEETDEAKATSRDIYSLGPKSFRFGRKNMSAHQPLTPAASRSSGTQVRSSQNSVHGNTAITSGEPKAGHQAGTKGSQLRQAHRVGQLIAVYMRF